MNKTILLAVLFCLSCNAFSQAVQKKPLAKGPTKSAVVAKRKTQVAKKNEPLSTLFYFYKEGEWLKYKGNARSLGELYKDLGIDGRTYATAPACGEKDNDCSIMIGYKLFTDEPQWALMRDTTGIRRYAASFDLENLMSTWRFEFELKRGVEKRSLDDAFLPETLGAPARKTTYGSASSRTEVWEYDEHGLSITLKNGIAVSYIKND